MENRWEKGRSKQRVIATVGRLDQLRQSGQLDGLLQSGGKFAEAVMVLAAHRQGEAPAIHTRSIGPALVFGRLWEARKSSSGCWPADTSRLPWNAFSF